METDQAVNSASFKVNNFEGSLDLLLQIIRENGINIYDIPIASITDQYLSYLDYIPADLDNLTEFYALAATLLCIKSRMLLPVEEAEIDGELTAFFALLLRHYKHASDETTLAYWMERSRNPKLG